MLQPGYPRGNAKGWAVLNSTLINDVQFNSMPFNSTKPGQHGPVIHGKIQQVGHCSVFNPALAQSRLIQSRLTHQNLDGAAQVVHGEVGQVELGRLLSIHRHGEGEQVTESLRSDSRSQLLQDTQSLLRVRRAGSGVWTGSQIWKHHRYQSSHMQGQKVWIGSQVRKYQSGRDKRRQKAVPPPPP